MFRSAIYSPFFCAIAV